MDKQSRRDFISTTGKATIMGGLGFGAAGISGETGKLGNVFIHHVYFWLKNPESEQDQQQLIAGLQKLSAAKTIHLSHIGKPAPTNREVIDRSYQVSWLLIFKNDADQATYQTDPIHLKFIDECSKLWDKVVVYDSIQAG